jgi:hypothetical protein
VDFRVEGLDPAVEHLREARVSADFGDVKPRVQQKLRGAARRDELDAVRGEAAGKVDEPRLIGDAQERALDRGHQNLMPCAFIFLRNVLRLMPSISAACV